MKRSMITLMLGLLACRRATPTAEPESEPQPPVFVEQGQIEAVKPPEKPLPPITLGMCPAMVGDAPTAFFDERVLVRLPSSLQGEDLVAFNPFGVKTSSPVHVMDCRDGDEYGAVITFAALTLERDRPAAGTEAGFAPARDAALNELGYWAHKLEFIERFEDPSGHLVMWVVADPGFDARLLVAVKKSAGFTVTMMLEASATDFPALVDSFVESGKRLLVVPG